MSGRVSPEVPPDVSPLVPLEPPLLDVVPLEPSPLVPLEPPLLDVVPLEPSPLVPPDVSPLVPLEPPLLEVVPLDPPLDVPLDPPLLDVVPLDPPLDVPLDPPLDVSPEVPPDVSPEAPPDVSPVVALVRTRCDDGSVGWYSARPQTASPPANSAAPPLRRVCIHSDCFGDKLLANGSIPEILRMGTASPPITAGKSCGFDANDRQISLNQVIPYD